ncbi:DUF4348 domain-containing protein [Portibacter marinus]|uniref:DUF4348 domain-containing protein n=1 Tax=Portibacter marinus TaxID=2898660 RepID=UPI001F397E2B|nr:DUF4348 domain-containing protein [Portibacter marinus]
MPKPFKLIIFCACFLTSCNNSKPELQEEPVKESGLQTELPDGFHDFYDQFHSDSSFQMSHIVFPLKGEMTSRDSMETLTLEKTYVSDSWKLHRPFNMDAGYSRSFTVLGDLVIEKIQDNMGLLTIERRWGKVDSTWSLIYYGTEEKNW